MLMRKMMNGHRHHIIPRHMGGSDDPSNLIEVSVEEHAELHFSLYLTYGKFADWVAYHMLSGRTSESEKYRLELSNEACRGVPLTDEHKKKLSRAHKGKVIPPEVREKIKKTLTGVSHSQERTEKSRQTRMKKMGEKHKKLYTFRLDDGTLIEEYGTIKGLSRKYNIPKTSLRRRLCGTST